MIITTREALTAAIQKAFADTFGRHDNNSIQEADWHELRDELGAKVIESLLPATAALIRSGSAKMARAPR